jgi:hypothetical protein
VAIAIAVKENALSLLEGELPECAGKSEQRAVKLLSLLKEREMTVAEMVGVLELSESSTGYVINLLDALKAGGVPLVWRVNADEGNKCVARVWGLKGITGKNNPKAKA